MIGANPKPPMAIPQKQAGPAPAPRVKARLNRRLRVEDDSPAFAALLRLLSPLTIDADPIVPEAALRVADLAGFWIWLGRDVAPTLVAELDKVAVEPTRGATALKAAAPKLADLGRHAVDKARENEESGRRLAIQLGGDAQLHALPMIFAVMSDFGLVDHAAEFSERLNGMHEVHDVAEELEAMTMPDGELRRFWFGAVARSIANPLLFLSACVAASGQRHIEAIKEAGYGEAFDAFLVDAQRQTLLLGDRSNLFADIDLSCRATYRFHAIARAVRYSFELPSMSTWAAGLTQLTREVSEAMDPMIREVTQEVIRALRVPREGADRMDEASVLQAYNSLYLLATTRDCREWLALNATADRVWTETGSALEVLVEKAMERFREAPQDPARAKRLDAAIGMSGIRFGQEYARTITRNRDAITRRRDGELEPPQETF